MKSVLEQLGLQFEKTSGNKLTFSFGPAATLKKKIDQGGAFDVAILTEALKRTLLNAKSIGSNRSVP